MKEDLSLQLALGPCQKHWSWVVNVQVWETGASAFWKFIESFFGTVHFTDAPKNHRRSSFKFSSQSLETARKKTVLGHKKPLARATSWFQRCVAFELKYRRQGWSNKAQDEIWSRQQRRPWSLSEGIRAHYQYLYRWQSVMLDVQW